MENVGLVYNLAFNSGSEGGKPQIVITMSEPNFRLLYDEVYSRFNAINESASNYVGIGIPFVLPSIHKQIGFNGCGVVSRIDGEFHLAFELSRDNLRTRVATLSVLFWLMNLVCKHDQSGKQQLMMINTSRSNSRPNGHAISGLVYPILGRWLKNQKADHEKKEARDYWRGYLLPAGIHKSMREAWGAVSQRELRIYANECWTGVTEDGRFILNVFGSASNVGTYPDQVDGDIGEYGSGFGSSNLDAPEQQIAALAGLAAMSDMARKEMNK